ncbi:MAG: N-acetylmuramoyl-L-alanine amidase [Candidatus Wallbacteria bacterium]|nr:N-acetylmuramoyl-L-alanine amidase [Candidatus Wallbacteria bacterium]
MKPGLYFIITAVFFFCINLHAQGYDYRAALDAIEPLTDADQEDARLWSFYLEKFSQVAPEEVQKMFTDAAAEFSVPVNLLQVIGYLENNWVHIGPSIDRGWGMMHLVENSYMDTLGKASELLGVSRQTLKDDPCQNIRGSAALLSFYAKQKNLRTIRLEDWFKAVEEITGLGSATLKFSQAIRYFEYLKNGVSEVNILNQDVVIKACPEIDLNSLAKYHPLTDDATATAVDYPGAVAAFSTCNYTSGRTHSIDTWVVHYVGVGTYAGAISWFHNSSANASAHFVIRNSDGEISQVIKAGDTAWSCGATNGQSNNQRSIGIEHEVTATHPEWWDSEIMLKNSAKLTRFFCDKYGIAKKHKFPGIVGHMEMPGCNTDCPADCPWDKLMGLITEDTPAPTPDPAPTPAPTPAPDPTPTPSPDPSYKTGVVDSADGVANVRKGPDSSYSVLTTLKNGTEVKVMGLEEENWYKVIIPDGRTGYIHKSILTVK